MPGTALTASPPMAFGSVEVFDFQFPTSSVKVLPGQTLTMFCCHWHQLFDRTLASTSLRLGALMHGGPQAICCDAR